jgi:hypothetical protein
MIFIVAAVCVLTLFVFLAERARGGSEAAEVALSFEMWSLMVLGILGVVASFAFAIVSRQCDTCQGSYPFLTVGHVATNGTAVIGTVCVIVTGVMVGKQRFRAASTWMIAGGIVWASWAALAWPRLGV